MDDSGGISASQIFDGAIKIGNSILDVVKVSLSREKPKSEEQKQESAQRDQKLVDIGDIEIKVPVRASEGAKSADVLAQVRDALKKLA